MTKNINLSYEINIKELRNTIKEFYSKSEIIPSIYLLKRKFAKIIIDNLYSIYYNELEDVEVNYDSLYFFYLRIYNSYYEIKNNNLKIKIEIVLNKLQQLLLDKIKKQQIILKELETFNQLKSEVEFNNIELKEIKKICSVLEKKRKDEKCFYTKTNNEYIILKFTISFLNFIKCKSNSIIHIILDKYSEFFHFIEIKNKDNLIDFIRSILDKDKIQKKIKMKDLINNFFFEETQINRINNIIDKIQEYLINDNSIKIEKKNISKLYLDKKKEIIKLELDLIKIKNYFDNILKIKRNINEKQLLGFKEYRYIKNYNRVENQLFNELNSQINIIKKELDTINLFKNEILNDIDNIIIQNILIEKIKIRRKEIASSKKIENFSLNLLFNQWKEKEYENIKDNIEGIIRLTVINELKNFELNDLKGFLIKFYTSYNLNIDFYEEEADLNLNLFLYKNKINPHLCKFNYEFIEFENN